MKFLMLLPLFMLPPGSPPQILKKVNVDYMLRGYFYAASADYPELAGAGGWGGSGNGSHQFTAVAGGKGLEILVDTTAVVPFATEFEGFKVIMRNHGPETLYFPAQDSRLDMKTQAMRADTFADIEYLPGSWCGNSYHTLYLAAGEQWEFTMPKYGGKRSTRLRLEVRYGREPDRHEGIEAVYSHTLPGAVNDGQFSEKQGHNPQGLMDPYDE
ncbi:MAG: hypothetical protein KA352_09425 [Flavobacteriales bacterium]|nr:hypothetical protein [Flavobacteriales bacterium]